MRTAWLPSTGVLVDFPVLHDDDKIQPGIFEHLDIGQWIPIHEQQIGTRAFLDHAKLAVISRPSTLNQLFTPAVRSLRAQ